MNSFAPEKVEGGGLPPDTLAGGGLNPGGTDEDMRLAPVATGVFAAFSGGCFPFAGGGDNNSPRTIDEGGGACFMGGGFFAGGSFFGGGLHGGVFYLFCAPALALRFVKSGGGAFFSRGGPSGGKGGIPGGIVTGFGMTNPPGPPTGPALVSFEVAGSNFGSGSTALGETCGSALVATLSTCIGCGPTGSEVAA